MVTNANRRRRSPYASSSVDRASVSDTEAGSSILPLRTTHAPLAQLVEQQTLNLNVDRSSRSWRTIFCQTWEKHDEAKTIGPAQSVCCGGKFRKAGVHGKTGKAMRRQEKIDPERCDQCVSINQFAPVV